MIPADRSDLIVATATHAGETGKNNEDRFSVDAYRYSASDRGAVTVAVVADGIGGHRAGEVAADLAVSAIRQTFSASNSRDQLENIRRALGAANRAIYERAQAHAEQSGMGCTAAIAVIADRKLYIAGVGDSRAYLMRGQKIQQMTTDHTWIADAIRAGVLTPEAAKDHPNRHVVRRYVGYKPEPEVDYGLRLSPTDTPEQAQRNQGFALQPGDAVLLCSDGLTDLVEDAEIHAAVAGNSPQAAVENLVLLARQRGGHDNITVALMVVPGQPPAAPEKARRLKPEYIALAGIILGALVIVLGIAGLGAWVYLNRPTPTPAATPARSRPTESPPAVLPATPTLALSQSPGPVEGTAEGPTNTAALPTDTPTPTDTPAPPTTTSTPETPSPTAAPETPGPTAAAETPGAASPTITALPTIPASTITVQP